MIGEKVDLLDAGQRVCKFSNVANLRSGRVKGGDGGYAHGHAACILSDPLGVLQDQLVGSAGKGFVLCAVHVLDVHEHVVHVRDDALNDLSLGKAGGLDRGGKAVIVAGTQQSLGKFGLCKTFTTGQRNAAARALKIHAVLGQLFHQLAYGNVIADRFFLAALYHLLDLEFLRFGVAAPLAAQEAALQEYDGADSGSVMDRITLYIKDTTDSVVILFHNRSFRREFSPFSRHVILERANPCSRFFASLENDRARIGEAKDLWRENGDYNYQPCSVLLMISSCSERERVVKSAL